MPDKQSVAPESTALRVALWRAMHTEVDAPPYVLEDDIGLQLIAPDDGWRDRPDMHPQGTRGFRASVIGRARFIEIWSPSAPSTVSRSTCCSARGSTPLRSAGRASRRACRCSRWTSRARRRGSGSA